MNLRMFCNKTKLIEDQIVYILSKIIMLETKQANIHYETYVKTEMKLQIFC